MGVLERDAFVESLMEYAGDAASGASRLVFVAGEAGVGKTTLLGLLRDRLPDVRWVVGACDGSFTPEPLGPLFDIAPQLGGALATACADGAPRERLFRVLLEQLAPPAPLTVVVIEDAHWADEATTDLLRFLGRRLRDSRTLLVVSYRDDGLPASHPLRLTLGDLASERSLRRITVPPLSPSAVSELAADSGIAAGELYALTGGNPFFVNEVLAGDAPGLPVSARDAVLARVARLSPAARALLDAAAVLGVASAPAVLAAVAGSDAGLEECLENGLLVATEDGVGFRHELARRAVEDALAPHRRRELHAAALASLDPSDLSRLAHHAEGAHDTEAVLTWATAAGRRAVELSAHREAAAQFDRAVRFAADRPLPERAELHDALAAELIVIEQWERALEEWREAVRLWRECGDQLRLGSTLRRSGRAAARMYKPEGITLSAESIAVLEALPPSRELAWAYADEAGNLMYLDPQAGIARARQARALLAELGLDDPGLVSDALNTEACCRYNLDEEPVEMLEEALRIAVAGGAQAQAQATRAYSNLVANLGSRHHYARTIDIAREAIDYCANHELPMHTLCLKGALADMLFAMGQWDQTQAICETELVNPRLSPYNRFNPCLTMALLHARRGDHETAATYVDQAAVIAAGNAPAQKQELALVLVELAWLRGEPDEARRIGLAAARPDSAPAFGALAVWMRRLGEEVDVPVEEVRRRQLSEPWPAVAAMWADLGAPYEQALARFDSGEEEPMREAIALLDGLGATAAINVVRADMRRRGFRSIPRGSRSTTRSDAFGLTARQREVSALVAEGLTNAEISRKLVLSERTVDHHVAAVLAKLGVESRRDAARLLQESAAVAGASG